MFRRQNNNNNSSTSSSGQTGAAAIERVTSVLGPGINWRGSLRGAGGVRIEGTFEGDMQIRGMIVVGETGRVTCMNMRANTIVWSPNSCAEVKSVKQNTMNDNIVLRLIISHFSNLPT